MVRCMNRKGSNAYEKVFRIVLNMNIRNTTNINERDKKSFSKQALLCLGFIFLPSIIYADLSQEEIDKWLESDELAAPSSTDHVSEGELRFLKSMPDKRVPVMINNMTIHRSSLEQGWVDIEQCHENMDPVPELAVVYRYHKMRNLKILSAKGISVARVESQSVQLEDIAKGARLCVSLQARILYPDGARKYSLRNGPFERRFLDGYYPLNVRMQVNYPQDLLKFTGSIPEATSGFEIQRGLGKVHVNALFEGKLTTQLNFELLN